MLEKYTTKYPGIVSENKQHPFSFFKMKKVKYTATYSILGDDIKRHIGSFFTMNALISMSSVDKSSNKICGDRFKDLLLQKFNIQLPKKYDPRVSYLHLKKEHSLFIAYSHGFYLEKNTFDWNLMAHLAWTICVLEDDSFNFFLSSVKKARGLFEEQSSDNAAILECNQIEFNTNFHQLLTNPFLLKDDELMTRLIYLCRIDAFYALKLIFNRHPHLTVCITTLLKEAISSLNVQTVNTLLELGADIHQFISYSDHRDYGFKLFCSPLFFALMLPEESCCSLNQFGHFCRWDNPKLLQLLVFLISKGAQPEQNCIFTEIGAVDLKSAKKKEDRGINCVTIAKETLNNPNSRYFSSAYLELMENIVNLKQQSELNPIEQEQCPVRCLIS